MVDNCTSHHLGTQKFLFNSLGLCPDSLVRIQFGTDQAYTLVSAIFQAGEGDEGWNSQIIYQRCSKAHQILPCLIANPYLSIIEVGKNPIH